jgi:hypothetical protein
MKGKKIKYSKYQNDDKLKIYKESSMNKFQYKQMIENAKPRFMNEYLNSSKNNRKSNEKNLNNLLNGYMNNYKKLKNKYNFIKNEDYQDDSEEENNYFNYEDFQEKKRDLNLLFLSYEIPVLENINFDLTDDLINNLNKGKNETLLRNTQINTDYNLRLKEANIFKYNYLIEKENKGENKIENIEEENNNKQNKEQIQKESDKKNIIKEKNYDINQKKEDEREKVENKKTIEDEEEEIYYLDGDKQENNDDDYLILKYKNDDFDGLHKFKDIINSNYNKEFELPLYEISKSEINKYSQKEKEKKNEEDLDEYNDIYGNKDDEEKKIEKEENSDEYNDFYRNKEDDKLEKINEKEKNLKLIDNSNNNKLTTSDNIISKDFKENYSSQAYDINKNIKEETNEYGNNKIKNNIIDDSNEIKLLKDIIEYEDNQKEDDIINNDKKVYNPPYDFPNEDKQNKNVRYSDYDVGEFISLNPKDENKNNEDKKNEEENKLPIDGKIINQNYNEDQIIEPKEGNSNNSKENIKKNGNDSDKIVVDDLDDDIEGDYGGFD